MKSAVFVILAILCILLGVIAGPYVTFYEGWFKGIVGIINFCRSGGDTMDLAFSIIRILAASFAGTVVAWFCFIVGKIFMAAAK